MGSLSIMKIQLKKVLTKEVDLPLPTSYSIIELVTQGNELVEKLTDYLTDFTKGILDPTIANSNPSQFIYNLENNRLGDFSKRSIRLACHQEKVIGVLIALPDCNDMMHIFALHIAVEYRRKGVGSQLLLDFINIAYSKGMKEVILDVHKDNYPAYRLYKKLGFVETS